MADNGNGTGPFWTSRKFWMEVVAAAVFVAFGVTETVTFSSTEVLVFVLGLAGIATGAHAATDIAAIISAALEARARGGLGSLGGGDDPQSEPGDTLPRRGLGSGGDDDDEDEG